MCVMVLYWTAALLLWCVMEYCCFCHNSAKMGHLCHICRYRPAHSYLCHMLLCKMLLQREKEEKEEAGPEDQYERDLRNYNRSTGERWVIHACECWLKFSSSWQ